jgi:hypothetical protein
MADRKSLRQSAVSNQQSAKTKKGSIAGVMLGYSYAFCLGGKVMADS